MSDTQNLAEIKDLFDRTSLLYDEMVGSLYPPIVYEDLLVLRQRYEEAGGKWSDLRNRGYIPAPSRNGYR